MKRLATAAAIVALVVAAGAHGLAADLLSDLGISEGRAREAFFDSFASGAVSLVGNVQVFKAASPALRAGMVKTVTALARTYAESDDFARGYGRAARRRAARSTFRSRRRRRPRAAAAPGSAPACRMSSAPSGSAVTPTPLP